MTLTEMRYLVALARERHFGRAAEACHVSQPTLSVAIKKVEGQLGAALFERNAADVRITPVGERVVAQARKVLEESLRLEEIAVQGRDPLTGMLRLGVIYTVAPYLLPQFIPALHRQAPNMPLFLKEDFTANLLVSLKAGELDVIVIALPLDEAGLVGRAVYDEPFRVVVPVDHPWAERRGIGPDEMEGQNLLLLGRGNCFRDQVLEACPKLSAPSALGDALEGGSLETIRHMVASGAGVAVMPSTASDPWGDQGMVRVLEFAGSVPSRQIGLVWRLTFPRPQAIDAISAAIQSCALPGTCLPH
ncbi:MAG: hydrogen peroxide-inducible s activator [Proteobacteria bacterium]|nr:hydrogen peroxide-inducible s activator [Pseudomonadota bacterium]